jgi:uncharacterized membrane protein HdeD (DUF308 family)
MTAFNSSEGYVPPPPRPIEYQDVDARGWWLSVLFGVLLVGLGVWILTNLYESVVVLAWLAGVSLIIGGVVEIASLGGRHSLGWVAWLGGGILVIAGLILLVWPDATLWVLAVVAGLCLLTVGIFRVVVALANRDQPDWAFDLGLGGFALATGAVVLAWPGATLVVLAVIFGIRTIGMGLVAIGIGWQLHRLAT